MTLANKERITPIMKAMKPDLTASILLIGYSYQ